MEWGDKLDSSGAGINHWGNTFYESETLLSSRRTSNDHIDWELNDEQYIVIQHGETIFTPYIGKPYYEFEGIETPSNATFNLQSYTWEELLSLKQECEFELWKHCEGNVTISPGVYRIGTDIPAGRYSISSFGDDTAMLYWGDRLKESGSSISEKSYFNQFTVLSSKGSFGGTSQTTWELKEGQFLISKNSKISLGTPVETSLGFK